LRTKVVYPVVVAVLAAIIIALLTGAFGKAKEWVFPTKVTVTGTVVIGGQPVEGVQLTLDDHPVEPTDERGRFVLENVGKGEHELALGKVGTWPQKPYKFNVGANDKELRPLALEPLVNVRFIYDEGQPAATVQYEAYVWLLGRPNALKQVKSVLYELPVWVGKTATTGAAQQPFCYAVAGQVDFGFLGQHSADPVIATVTLRSGDRFKTAGVPNLPGEAHPNCPLNGGGGGGGGSGGGGGGSGGGGGGVTKRVVPDVVGQSFESAASELQSFGFTVVRIDVESDEAQGVVVAQSPKGGTSQLPGTRITLRVSEGPMTLVTVPDVTDTSEATATVKLEDNHFKIHVLTEGVSDPAQDGVVIRQDPPGGTQATFGSTVTIVVGKY
jgi:uncharacterized membrane protein YgcG